MMIDCRASSAQAKEHNKPSGRQSRNDNIYCGTNLNNPPVESTSSVQEHITMPSGRQSRNEFRCYTAVPTRDQQSLMHL